MNLISGKAKLITYGAVILMVAGIVTSATFMSKNSKLNSGLNTEKLKSESLLSEKLSLDKEIIQMKDAIASLTGQNVETDKLLAEAKNKLSEKERAMARVMKDNATTKSLRKELAEIKDMKENLLKQADALNGQNKNLASENQQLQKSLAQLQSEKDELIKQNEMARVEILNRADNFQVDAFRNAKKDKITNCAKRTKEMTVIIDVPKELGSDVSFNITTPDGTVINEKNKSLSWQILKSSNTLLASVYPLDDTFTVTHQVKLTYKPGSKMKSGVYKIGILSKGKNIGNCRVRLK